MLLSICAPCVLLAVLNSLLIKGFDWDFIVPVENAGSFHWGLVAVKFHAILSRLEELDDMIKSDQPRAIKPQLILAYNSSNTRIFISQ